mmetsp:Transcript_37714/g.94510  ORF Transcript_37714/g.94510 Transcript_37714/m.94510 type:complete len:126 (-) Transcript_37714:637-1014(-)
MIVALPTPYPFLFLPSPLPPHIHSDMAYPPPGTLDVMEEPPVLLRSDRSSDIIGCRNDVLGRRARYRLDDYMTYTSDGDGPTEEEEEGGAVAQAQRRSMSLKTIFEAFTAFMAAMYGDPTREDEA